MSKSGLHLPHESSQAWFQNQIAISASEITARALALIIYFDISYFVLAIAITMSFIAISKVNPGFTVYAD